MRLRLAIMDSQAVRPPPSPLQADDALGVIAAVLFNPDKAAIGVGRLVGRELIGAGFGAGLVEIFLALVFRRDRRREHGRGLALAALVAAEVDPFTAIELAGDLYFQIFHPTRHRR